MSFLAAIAFLTVLPLPSRVAVSQADLSRSARWFPLVGLGLGICLAGLDLLLGQLLAQPARDALLVLAGIVLTGALHLDGLMDTCDGYFAPVSSERRLTIMRDSHVGSFGVAGAGLVLLARFAALSSLSDTPRWAALIVAAVLGRWGMTLSIGLFPPGRSDGLGRLVKDATGAPDILFAAGLTVLISSAAFGLAGAILFVVTSALVYLTARALVRRLSGLTGDAYGALNEMAEVLTLGLAPVCAAQASRMLA